MPTNATKRFELALAQYNALGKQLAELAQELPLPPKRLAEARVVTVGYQQWCSAERESGSWRAWTDGWDDMSEDGDASFLFDEATEHYYRVPDDLDWN